MSKKRWYRLNGSATYKVVKIIRTPVLFIGLSEATDGYDAATYIVPCIGIDSRGGVCIRSKRIMKAVVGFQLRDTLGAYHGVVFDDETVKSLVHSVLASTPGVWCPPAGFTRGLMPK